MSSADDLELNTEGGLYYGFYTKGLNIAYWNHRKLTPSIGLLGRSPVFEPVFFQNIGINKTMNDKEFFDFNSLMDCIANDVPVILLTDLYYLDYVDSYSYFSGHAITLIGYNQEKDLFYVSDSMNKDPTGFKNQSYKGYGIY